MTKRFINTTGAVDRVVHALLACVLFLTVLFLWRRTHEQSCLALAFPILTFLAVFGGLLEHRLEQKRFVVDYYLDSGSTLRRRLRRSGLSVLISLAAALPFTAFLAVFAARSRPADWLFFCTAAAVAPLLFKGLSVWPGCHFRRDGDETGRRVAVADVLAVRMAGTLLLTGLAIVYVYASYYLIPLPGQDIFPDSLGLTVEAFSAQGGSACPVVDNALMLTAQIEGLSWYFVTTAATAPWMHDGIGLLLWVGFFLNMAMVFGGFVRGLEGSMLLALRLVQRYRREWGMSTENAPESQDSRQAERQPVNPRNASAAAPPAPPGRAGALTWAYGTILTLISATLLLLIVAMVRQPQPQQDPQPAGQPSVDVNPDTTEPAISDDELEAQAQLQWSQFRERMLGDGLPRTDLAIDEQVDMAFAPVYEDIPEFLDWHYSILGQYTELGQAALGTLENAIEERLFAALQERIGTATEAVTGVMQEEIRTEIEDWVRREAQTVPDGVMTTYERMLEVTVAATVERFTVSAVPSALVAVGTGVGSTVAVAVIAKALAKKIMASAAVKVMGKAGGGIWGHLGGAAGGAAIGSLLGPIGAAVGGVAGGAAAWLAVDGVVVNIDEHLNRKDLERELIALVDEQKASVKSTLATAVDDAKLEALREVTPSELSNRQ